MSYKRGGNDSTLPGPALVFLWVAVVLFSGCARRPEPVAARREAEVLQEVVARRAGFTGLETAGTLTLKRQSESYTLPFSLTVSSNLRVEVKGEISHFLLPFSGQVRLVSDDEATLLYTDIGVYDLAQDPDAQAALRAFLLSLVGGGDWLAWWLAENGCEVVQETACGVVKIELEPATDLPSVGRWAVSDTSRGSTFRAEIESREPGTLLPSELKGILYPQEIAVSVTYQQGH